MDAGHAPGKSPVAAKKKSSRKTDAAPVDTPPDPREPLGSGAAARVQVLQDLQAVLRDLEAPAEPKAGDLFEAVLHLAFADGLPCGYGQEARRRIAENFVDRNEFRVSEAYEVEELLRDMPIPSLFERCLAVREAVGQIYSDQNGMDLAFLREASITDRNSFFQRVAAMPPAVVAFLNNLLTVEELVFSDKSILRVLQRLGMDPKDAATEQWIAEVRALLKPYGHLPLDVGKNYPSGRPNLNHPLSPACILVRLAAAGKRR